MTVNEHVEEEKTVASSHGRRALQVPLRASLGVGDGPCEAPCLCVDCESLRALIMGPRARRENPVCGDVETHRNSYSRTRRGRVAHFANICQSSKFYHKRSTCTSSQQPCAQLPSSRSALVAGGTTSHVAVCCIIIPLFKLAFHFEVFDKVCSMRRAISKHPSRHANLGLPKDSAPG